VQPLPPFPRRHRLQKNDLRDVAGQVMEKEKITNDTLPKDIDYIHLWFLGVSPFMQGKGEGKKYVIYPKNRNI
jgi:ribosomal protein S18 acetylase RimI-like enzyme